MNSPAYGYTWVSAIRGLYAVFVRCLNWYDSFGWEGSGWELLAWWGGGGYLGVNVGTVYGAIIRRCHTPPRGPVRPLLIRSIGTRWSGWLLPARDKTSIVDIAGYTTQACGR